MFTLIMIMVLVSCGINGLLLYKNSRLEKKNLELDEDVATYQASYKAMEEVLDAKYKASSQWKALAKAYFSMLPEIEDRVSNLKTTLDIVDKALDNERSDVDNLRSELHKVQNPHPNIALHDIISHNKDQIPKICKNCDLVWYPGILYIGECDSSKKKKAKKKPKK